MAEYKSLHPGCFHKNKLKLDGIQGMKVLVVFIAGWCGHCKKLIPNLHQAVEELSGEHIIFTVDEKDCKDVLKHVGVRGFPTICTVDPNHHTVQAVQTGRDVESLKRLIQSQGPYK